MPTAATRPNGPHASTDPLLDEAMFRRLVEGVSDYAIFMLTTDGRVASWNAGAQRLKGYRADEIIGQHFSVFYPAEAQRTRWPEEELRRAERDGRFEDEGWRVRQDGTRFWANVVITAVRDEAGRLLGFSKVTRDLTERREQENRLRESERSLRLLIDGVQDYAIFRLDPHGVITSWNLGAQRIKGYAADEIIGRHFSVFYPSEAIASGWPEEELRRASAAGRFEDEGWRVRKDGTRLWANVVITAIRGEDGELLGFSKVTRDLTQRREQEERLRESEESLRLVVEGVRDHAMFLIDQDGRVASWNSGAQRVLGFRAEDIVGQPVARSYPDEDRSAGRPQAELAAASHAGFHEAEGWRVRADGQRVWTSASLTTRRDAQGRLQGFVQIVRDQSQSLRMQQLEDEGQRIHEFIAMLSHELRNPLAPIGNAVRILQQRSGGDRDVMWCADLIGRQTQHLSRLVEDLLDVSRITRGKVRLQPATVELGELVRRACDAMRPGAEAAGLSLEASLPGSPVCVDGDPTRLTQVLSNLLANATKYTPAGGRIDVALAADGEVAHLQVTDTGMGMSEALMARAFDPFVQGSRALDRPGGGLGIGLTLVRSVVELHGGSVAVSSAGEGRGTRFTVTLPLSERNLEITTPTPSPQQVAAKRLLVVDDNLDAADSLAELLRLAGHSVHTSHDGPEALADAAATPPDVVLLDLGLPGMDGFEIARRLRGMPALSRTRLIALTGYGQRSDREKTAAAGFDDHLVKPVDVEELMQVIADGER